MQAEFIQRIPSAIICILICYSMHTYGNTEYILNEENPLTQKWRWREFEELNGKGVRNMDVDENGNIWIGTKAGVIFYDGVSLTEYKNSELYLDAIIYGVLCDSRNKTWVVSSKGISVYSEKKWTPLVAFSDTTFNWSLHWRYSDFAETLDGSIYITSPYGLFKFHKNRNTAIRPKEKLDEFKISSNTSNFNFQEYDLGGEDAMGDVIFNILASKDGGVWFATYNGVVGRFKSKDVDWSNINKCQFYSTPPRETDLEHLPILFESKTSEIYMIFAARIEKAMKLNKRTKSFDPIGSPSLYSSLTESDDGAIWLGGFGTLSLLKNSKWRVYVQPEVPISQSFISVYSLNSGELWVIGDMDNLHRFDYNTKNFSSYLNLNFHCEDTDGNLWFINSNGKVVKYSNSDESWNIYSDEAGVIDCPTAIYIDSKERLWVIGSHLGTAAISCYQEGNWIIKQFSDLCWGFDSRAFLETRKGEIYLGSAADCGELSWGVVKYNPNLGDINKESAWHIFEGNKITELSYSFAEDREGNILSGYYGGLFVYDGKTTIQQSDFIGSRIQVQNMTQSKDSSVWIGTRTNGVIHYYDKENWKQYTTKDGIASNTINAILIANDNTVYASTDKGISRFDGEFWQTNALPRELKMLRESGSIAQSKDGTIWLNAAPRSWSRRQYHVLNSGSVDSSLSSYGFYPDKIEPQTSLDYLEAKVSPQGISFISWNGIDPFERTKRSDLEYSFRLNDDSWSPFSKEKSKLFIELKPGKYVIQVRARDNNLMVDSSPAQGEFKVLAPLWKRPLFFTLIISVLLTILALIYRIIVRNKEIEKQNDEVAESNKVLRVQQEELKTKSEELIRFAELEKQTNWINEGMVKFDSLLRSSTLDLNELGKKIINEMIRILNIQQAILYVRKEDKEELAYITSYFESNYIQKSILIGENQVGTVFQQKNVIRVNKVPESSCISSGLGSIVFTDLYIFPILYNQECIGVIEVGAMDIIEDKAIDFLKKVIDNLAVAIENIMVNKRMSRALELSKNQAVLLTEHEEELRQNLEELSCTQEEMRRREEMLIKEIESLKSNQKA